MDKKIILLCALLTLVSCDNKKQNSLSKDVRWVRQSVEYVALCQQTYQYAWQSLKDRIEKNGEGQAVVFDVDETVLDNSLYEDELQMSGLTFSAASWAKWVDRREAVAIPGAKAFLDSVRKHFAELQIAFITNRDATQEKATRENLINQGLWANGDVLMGRRNKQDTKVKRRAELSEGKGRCEHLGGKKIVALFGDNLKDFYKVKAEKGIAVLKADALESGKWGTEYFILPNPMYGSWEKAYK